MKAEFVLTKAIQPVVDAIGYDYALHLVGRYGGTRVVVPRKPTANDPLVKCIGLEMARRLGEGIGPGLLELPRCVSWLLARRNEEISVRYLGGETQAELALRFQLTERHIRNVLRQELGDAAPRKAGPQADLFEPSESITP